MFIGALIGIGFLVVIFLIILFVIGIIMFLISTISLTVTIIKAKKSKFKILPLVFSIVGVIIGSALTVPVFFMISVSREADKKTASSYIDTGTVTYWENEKLYEKEFILNDRRYKYLLLNHNIDVNEPLANIYTKKDENKKPGLLQKITGSENYGKVIYSLRDNNDYKLLTVGYGENHCYDIYCDADFHAEKKEYYDNDINYNYYITKVSNNRLDIEEHKILARPIQKEEYFELIKEFRFNYSSDYEVVLKKDENVHITLFKISKDNIVREINSSIILDNGKLYNSTYEAYQKIRVSEFSKERTDYILSLLE